MTIAITQLEVITIISQTGIVLLELKLLVESEA